MENKKASLPQLLIILAITIAISFYHAFVFMKVYNWFIPLATGWTPIGYWLAFGIIILIDLVKSRKDSKDKSFREYLIGVFVTIAIISTFFGFAALIHLGV